MRQVVLGLELRQGMVERERQVQLAEYPLPMQEAEAEEQIQQARLEAVGRAAEEMVQILGTALTEPTIREGAVVAQGGVEPPHQAEQAALAS